MRYFFRFVAKFLQILTFCMGLSTITVTLIFLMIKYGEWLARILGSL